MFVIRLALLILSCAALYPSETKVIVLTVAQLREKMSNSPRPWLVEFFAPWCGHCRSLVPEYERAAAALNGIVVVAAVNADGDAGAAAYNLKGFPTIKFFGADKTRPTEYNGARSATAMVDFALTQLRAMATGRLGGAKPSAVRELTDIDFKKDEHWLVMFYAPWCGHCKNAMPQFEAAASESKALKFGRIDCDAHKTICANYNVRGYPTIKLFADGQVDDYEGSRTRDAFLDFAATRSAPRLEFARLDSQQRFERYCRDFDGLCLIAFLPDVRDVGAEHHATQLADLGAIAAANARSAIAVLWAQGGEQLALEDKLGLSFGYPALLAIHGQKRKFAVMRKKFERGNIERFISELLSGETAIHELPTLPVIRSPPTTEEL